MDTRKRPSIQQPSLAVRVSLYSLAVVVTIFRLIDNVKSFGLLKGVAGIIIIDGLTWTIILGWFGLVPGVEKFKLKDFRGD